MKGNVANGGVPGRIAFIHYPYGATCWIEARPFAFNVVKRLAESGWRVDLFLAEQQLPHIESFCSSNKIRLFYVQKTNTGIMGRRLESLFLILRFAIRRGYRCVFTAGQTAAFLGALVAHSSRCPLVYLNDEFPSFWGQGLRTRLEGWAARRADLIVMPDQEDGLRYPELARELGLPPGTFHVDIPNTPLIGRVIDTNYDWHARLGIPSGMKILLYAGTLCDAMQVPEILSSVPHWPRGAALLLHSHTGTSLSAVQNQFSHLTQGFPVFWSSEILADDEFNSLVAYVDGCFALYRSTGPNLDLIGMSSGKLMRSLACGTPVIASHQESLAFVENYGLGFQVRHPVDIPRAIEKLLEGREDWRNRCKEFCLKGAGSFDGGWARLCVTSPIALGGLDLCDPCS